MKVVCIDDSWQLDYVQKSWNLVLPVKNVVYTIRERFTNQHGAVFLLLNEVINKPVQTIDAGLVEVRFDAKMFRPVTDISALQALTVIKTKNKVLEDV